VWGDDGKYHVLDFTFQRRSDGARFIAEMKCEIEFEGYKYLTLTGPDQVAHHQGSAAFTKFHRLAREPKAHPVTIGGKTRGYRRLDTRLGRRVLRWSTGSEGPLWSVHCGHPP
jgi:hypothetical protein